MLSDAGKIYADVDSMLGEMLSLADTREHQQLRRVDRPGADNHLAIRTNLLGPAIALDLDPYAAVALEQQALRPAVGQHGQVRRIGDRLDEGSVCVVSLAVLDVELNQVNPFEQGFPVLI